MKKLLFLPIFLIPFFALAPGVSANVDPLADVCRQAPNSPVCQEDRDTRPQTRTDNRIVDTLARVIEVMMYGLGVASVIAIIIGGVLYALSAGDPQKAQKARNTIIYAIVGLTVAVLSQLIITFVLDRL